MFVIFRPRNRSVHEWGLVSGGNDCVILVVVIFWFVNAFVNTVRFSGGNICKRFISIVQIFEGVNFVYKVFKCCVN